MIAFFESLIYAVVVYLVCGWVANKLDVSERPAFVIAFLLALTVFCLSYGQRGAF